MTPNINKDIMLSRPLWDPDPSTFVITEALKLKTGDLDLRRVRLSDFAIIAFKMAVHTGKVTKKAVDMFESVYVQGAEVRHIRRQDGSLHQGLPAIAPDGTVMSMGGVAYPGNSGLPAGGWTPESVHRHRKYDEWLRRLLQDTGDLTAGELQNMNKPFPSQEALHAANFQSYTPLRWWQIVNSVSIMGSESNQAGKTAAVGGSDFSKNSVMGDIDDDNHADVKVLGLALPTNEQNIESNNGSSSRDDFDHGTGDLSALPEVREEIKKLRKENKELRKENSMLRDKASSSIQKETSAVALSRD